MASLLWWACGFASGFRRRNGTIGIQQKCNEASRSEVLGEQARRINVGCAIDGGGQRLPAAKRIQELPSGSLQPSDRNVAYAALDQQKVRFGSEIEFRQCLIISIEHGAPNLIDRKVRPQQADRGMHAEAAPLLVFQR